MSLREKQTMSTNTLPTNTPATEDDIDALLREATDADTSAREARLWASPAYVAEAEAHAEKVWAAYRAASQRFTW